MTTQLTVDTPLQEIAVAWCDALLSSADVDTIGKDNWWDRARSALETAAAGAETYSHAVSIAADKLQITTLSTESSAVITRIGETVLTDPERLRAWLELCARDAVYLVALVRINRTARTTARKARAAGEDTLL